MEGKRLAPLDDIKTIVIVMMENRSFDHVFGYLSLPQHGGRKDVDGLVNLDTDPYFVNFYENEGYRPFLIEDRLLPYDLPHTRAEIRTQLAFANNGTATMSGFVQAFADSKKTVLAQPPVMGYQTPHSVFMSDFLARNYLICDRWFAPLPADTHPNRVMAFTGSAFVDDTKPRLLPDQNHVFEWLSKREIRWRVYHSGLPFFILFGVGGMVIEEHFRSIGDLASDLKGELADGAPQVIFIEPEYADSPIHLGFAPNCNHPPLPIGPGERLLRDIYTTLAGSPRWSDTMLIITYDEHGGFFDHVPPLRIRSAIPPGAPYAEPFETTGVRVPAMVVSPFVERGRCYSGSLDHTSILQMLAEKFAGDRRGYSEGVNERLDQGIESLSVVLSPERRTDQPAVPAAPTSAQEEPVTVTPANANRAAFTLAAKHLLAGDPDLAIRRFPELLDLDRD